MSNHVLIVEDEPSIAQAVVHALEAESFTCHWLALGAGVVELLERESIDLVLLDVGLPDTSGFDLCRDIKATSDVPIIFLTARQEEIDKLIGLEIGGDDYVTKPFSLRELVSRVKVVLRRYARTAPASTAPVLTDDKLHIDDEAKCMIYGGVPLELTRYEYRLLKTLAEQPNRVFSRDHLMQAVWEDPDTSFERAVDTHIKTLRKKLRAADAEPMPIKTHHGLGYSYTSASGRAPRT